MPVPSGRIVALDMLRGVAVMGILLLNIVGFGLPESAYLNPLGWGGDNLSDQLVYIINFVLFDGKMRGLFSFLFGASLLLVAERAEQAGRSAARVHFARMFWLLLFGLAHLYLIWWGDILAHYALVGCAAFFLRDLPAMRLVGLGVLLVLAQTVLAADVPIGLATAREQLAGADAPRAAMVVAQMQAWLGVPPVDALLAEIETMRGGYAAILADRWAGHAGDPLAGLRTVGAETLAYMLFGMAGLKAGLLSGEWTAAQYRRWAAIGLGVGLLGYGGLAAYLWLERFSMEAVALAVVAAATPVRPVMVLGWACLVLLLMRPGGFWTDRIAAAGRMAFSNYLGTSLICTSLFYGYGFGLFARLSRAELYPIVFLVWALMLLWSKPWLDRFRYGPLEWLWRSLARGSPQPLHALSGAAEGSSHRS